MTKDSATEISKLTKLLLLFNCVCSSKCVVKENVMPTRSHWNWALNCDTFQNLTKTIIIRPICAFPLEHVCQVPLIPWHLFDGLSSNFFTAIHFLLGMNYNSFVEPLTFLQMPSFGKNALCPIPWCLNTWKLKTFRLRCALRSEPISNKFHANVR